MDINDFPAPWSATLSELGLATGASQAPTGMSTPWYAPIMRFGTRGFLLVFLAPDTKGVKLRLELLLPESPEHRAHMGELHDALKDLGLSDVSFAQEPQVNAPALLDAVATFAQEARARATMLFLLKLGDYVTALEDDPQARPPYGAPPSDEERDEDTPSASPPSSSFESIGERDEPAARAPAAFESIGSSDGEENPRTEREGSHSAALRSFHLSSPSKGSFELELKFDSESEDTRALLHAIEQNIAVRFDAEIATRRHNPDPIIELRPGATSPTSRDLDDLYKSTHRYLDRLVKLGSRGPMLTMASASTRPSNDLRRTLLDTPHSKKQARALARGHRDTTRPPTQPAAAQNTGFVLSMSSDLDSDEGAQSQAQTSTLRPGDFTDERLRREDAAGSLVDVVLRHPGYSDRNMAKVLTLLLSIEYSQALELIEQAPCVLLWGAGLERAQTMKGVVEGAGGKVVLVEPDTFAAQ